jgi:hypothetical protein
MTYLAAFKKELICVGYVHDVQAVARKALIEISRIEERVERLMGSEHPGSHGGFTATHPIHLGGLAGL